MLFTLVHVLLHACMEYESPTQGISTCVKVHNKCFSNMQTESDTCLI